MLAGGGGMFALLSAFWPSIGILEAQDGLSAWLHRLDLCSVLIRFFSIEIVFELCAPFGLLLRCNGSSSSAFFAQIDLQTGA